MKHLLEGNIWGLFFRNETEEVTLATKEQPSEKSLQNSRTKIMQKFALVDVNADADFSTEKFAPAETASGTVIFQNSTSF